MVSESRDYSVPKAYVLILVLVEDGLGAATTVFPKRIPEVVLILVLVEDGLGGCGKRSYRMGRIVLILVLVEDGLGVRLEYILVPEALS